MSAADFARSFDLLQNVILGEPNYYRLASWQIQANGNEINNANCSECQAARLITLAAWRDLYVALRKLLRLAKRHAVAFARKPFETALSLFGVDNHGPFREGRLVQLSVDLYTKLAYDKMKNVEVPRERRVMRQLTFLIGDLFLIENILEQTDWLRTLWTKDEIDDSKWQRFTRSQIDSFHVTIRSLFDHLASIMREISEHPGSVSDSFNKVCKQAKKVTAEIALGKDLTRLINKCHWFADIKEVRDETVHRGAETIVFLDKPRILFQVFKHPKKLVVLREVMANENVVDFELYAGMIYALLLAYLEDFARIVYRRLKLKQKRNGRQEHPGLEVGKNWIENALERCARKRRKKKR